MDEDLARPLIEVRDFETGSVEFEIYTFGDQTVVVPISHLSKRSLDKVAVRIMNLVKNFDPSAIVEMISEDLAVVKVRRSIMPQIIGKNGKVVSGLEKRLGVRIKLVPKDESKLSSSQMLTYSFKETKSNLIFDFGKRLAKVPLRMFLGDEVIDGMVTDKRGRLKISLSSELGVKVLRTLESGVDLKFRY